MLSAVEAADPADLARASIRFLELSGLKDAADYIRSPEEVEMYAIQQAAEQQAVMRGLSGLAGIATAQAGGGGAGGGMPGVVP